MAGRRVHLAGSAINRKNNIISSAESDTSGGKSSNIGDGINKFID